MSGKGKKRAAADKGLGKAWGKQYFKVADRGSRDFRAGFKKSARKSVFEAAG